MCDASGCLVRGGSPLAGKDTWAERTNPRGPDGDGRASPLWRCQRATWRTPVLVLVRSPRSQAAEERLQLAPNFNGVASRKASNYRRTRILFSHSPGQAAVRSERRELQMLFHQLIIHWCSQRPQRADDSIHVRAYDTRD